MIEHVVLLKLKPLSPKDWDFLHLKFVELCKIIPGIQDFSFGPNFKYTEGVGFNYGLRVRFANPESLQTYIDHPLHVQFKDLLNPLEKQSVDWYLS